MTLPHQVEIYRPVKGATQSGRARTKSWVLEYELETRRQPESLMGWVASGDTLNQVRMQFSSKEEAIEFADKKSWKYVIIETQPRKLKGRTYMDNFKFESPAATQ